ncbi:MAG TPA: response regulator [Pyrinomonadaceae bacterium]|nr:response regulator [Pyrinomonadaceae bacterium]
MPPLNPIRTRPKAELPKLSPPKYTPPVILYAENNLMLLQIVKDVLGLAGWRVEHSYDGVYTRAMLEHTGRYDLLLLNDDLHGFGGIELARRARALPHRKETPIIILSLADRAEEAREAGANEFLRKPNDLLALVETVRRLLAGSGEEQSRK